AFNVKITRRRVETCRKHAAALTITCRKCRMTECECLMNDSNKPLAALDEWEDFLKERYPEPAPQGSNGDSSFKATDPAKKKEQFRNYEADARPTVREFYRLNHQHQTHDFVQAKRKEFLGLNRRKMSIWEALEYL